MNKNYLFILVMILGLFFSNSSYSQDSTATRALEEVIVSANKLEQKPIEVGRSVSVIGQQEIQRSTAGNVGELLSKQEGLHLIGVGQTPGAIQSVFLRGANSNHTIIMIDGVRISDPSSPDNGLDLSELALANVERIEVVRGSHGTIYGTSAIGGVVNIITKKASKSGISGNVSLQAGTFGSGTSDFSQNLALNYMTQSGFYLGGEIMNRNVDGLDAALDTVNTPNTFKNRDKDGFDKLDWIGKLGYRGKKLDVFASYKKTDQTTDLDDGAYRDDPNHTLNLNRDLFSYGVSYDLGKKWQVRANGGYTYLERLIEDDSSIIDALGNTDATYSRNNAEGTILNNELQLTYQSAKINTIFGLSNYLEDMTQQNYFFSDGFFGPFISENNLDTFNLRNTINNAFLHTELSGELLSEEMKRIKLALGVRFIDHNRFGNELTYEINPSVQVGEKGVLYASYTTGFNAPSLYQNYYRGYTVSGSSNNLNPEKSASFELGLKQEIIEGVSFSLAVFQTEVRNSIEYVYLWENKPVSELSFLDNRADAYVNLGTQTNTGFEFSLNAVIEEKFFLNANFNVVRGRLDYDSSDALSNQTDGYLVQLFTSGAFLNTDVSISGLARRSNTINLSFGYQPNKKLTLSTDLRVVGSRDDIFYDGANGPFGAQSTTPVREFTLIGFNANYQITKSLQASFRVDNILDTDYQEINGYTTRGRGFNLKLSYLFR